MTMLLTAANLTKMYVGIAFISTPKSIAMAGVFGSLVGFAYIVLINIYCIYILLKARNRFKKLVIIDICDLSAVLYGEWSRPIMTTLLIVTNATFLMCYVMYIGTQTDQLLCKTFFVAECGNNKIYSLIILASLLPILFLRKLSFIAYFSIFVLFFTFLAIFLIIYESAYIISKSPADVQEELHIKLTDEDRNYNYWDWGMIPVFCAAMMSLFEGN